MGIDTTFLSRIDARAKGLACLGTSILYLLLPLSLCAAEPPTIRLDGQIFIARADRETVKLSSVAVHIVERKAVLEAVKDVARIQDLEEDNDDYRRRSFALVEAILKMNREKAAQAKKTLAELKERYIANEKEVRALKAKLFHDSEFRVVGLFEGLTKVDWKAKKIVQTDPDGKFSAEVPAGDGASSHGPKGRFIRTRRNISGWSMLAQANRTCSITRTSIIVETRCR